MTNLTLTALYKQYPTVIAQMSPTFSSHDFILRLAQQNQRLYIEALYDYRDAIHRRAPAPFMTLHRILAKHLHFYPDLVAYVGERSSIDIFGRSNNCAMWQRQQ